MVDLQTRDLDVWDALVRRAHLELIDHGEEALEGAVRDAARQSTITELRSIGADALAEHVAHLTVARVTRARATALREARERESAIGPDDKRVSFSRALERALSSEGPLRDAWIATAESAWPGDESRLLAEMRNEAAARLGLTLGGLEPLAETFLLETRDLAHETIRSATKRDLDLAGTIEIALAKTASEGWPKSARIVIESLTGAAKLADRVRPPAYTPVVLGAASHARVFRRFGFELAVRAPSDEAFALRHDPLFASAHRVGLLVGSMLAEPSFHARVLGLGARAQSAQSRALAITGLMAARADAARILKREELSELLYGKPSVILPRFERDAAGRFAAWLALPKDLERARDHHDEDWFRNPRFWEELAIRIASRAEKTEGDPHALAAAFEARIA